MNVNTARLALRLGHGPTRSRAIAEPEQALLAGILGPNAHKMVVNLIGATGQITADELRELVRVMRALPAAPAAVTAEDVRDLETACAELALLPPCALAASGYCPG